MSHISFSFIENPDTGKPAILSYKAITDGVPNDNEKMAEVVMLLKDHIDALKSPGYHA